MDEGLLNADWAREAVARFEAIVLEWNTKYPGREPLRIAWGFSDKDALSQEYENDEHHRRQHGLLNWKNVDFDLFISMHAASENPDPEVLELELYGDGFVDVRISVRFETDETLPRTAPELFNTIESCFGSTPIVCPLIKGDEVEDEDEIIVLGLARYLPMEGLSCRTLAFHLAELWQSSTFVYDWLTISDGYDSWNSPEDE